MKYFSIFMLIHFSIITSASEVSVKTTNKKEIFLQGSDCKKLRKSEDDILNWTEKVEDHRPKSTDCFCKDEVCSINVTNSVPLFARKWHGVLSKTLSGNCWNTMFNANGILPFTRMTYPEELRFLLNSPIICKERPVSEPNQSGDMILIRHNDTDENEREIHGFVYINDELAFQKEGLGGGEPIEVIESRYAFENITSSICRKVDGNPPTDLQVAKKCPVYANVYSCSSIKQVLKSKEDQITNSTKEKLIQIDNIECDLQNKNNSPISQVNPNLLNSMKASLEVLKKWAENNSTKSENEIDQFFVSYILNRTVSSIGHINDSFERINEAKMNGKVGNELDESVETSERELAEKYVTWKNQVDISYSLLDFTNKYKRLPADTSKSSSEEKVLFLKLKEFDIPSRLHDNPEQFEFYLHPDVYRSLIKSIKT